MTNSEYEDALVEQYEGTRIDAEQDGPAEGETYQQWLSRKTESGEVLGVLTGQVPVRSMPVAVNQCKCPGDGTMAHVRGCPLHPEHDSE